MKNALVLLVLCTVLFGCRRSDFREMTVSIDGHVTAADRLKVQNQLSRYEGIRLATLAWKEDGQATQLTLVFDSMLVAEMNVIKAVEETGCTVAYPDLKRGAPAGYINARKPEVSEP